MSDAVGKALDRIRQRASAVNYSAATGELELRQVLDSQADVARLLRVVDALLERHKPTPEPVITRTVCARHARYPQRPYGDDMRAWRAAVDACPDCVKTGKYKCVTCRRVCPDDEQWPCAEYMVIDAALHDIQPVIDVGYLSLPATTQAAIERGLPRGR